MPNIGDIIMYNKATLRQIDRKTQTADKQCNCRNQSSCPLEGRYKEGPIVYKATLTLHNKSIVYVYHGSCKTKFKSRYSNHPQAKLQV